MEPQPCLRGELRAPTEAPSPSVSQAPFLLATTPYSYYGTCLPQLTGWLTQCLWASCPHPTLRFVVRSPGRGKCNGPKARLYPLAANSSHWENQNCCADDRGGGKEEKAEGDQAEDFWLLALLSSTENLGILRRAGQGGAERTPPTLCWRRGRGSMTSPRDRAISVQRPCAILHICASVSSSVKWG
jgi:hypothetical protein